MKNIWDTSNLVLKGPQTLERHYSKIYLDLDYYKM